MAAEPRFNAALPRFKVQGRKSKVEGWARLLLTSDIILQTSDIFFRTTPVPFNLEGAPPLSCILPPQEEENRSACRSYIMVSADHQRSGFFFALRRFGSMRLCRGSRFKVQGSRFSDLQVQSDPRVDDKVL